MTEPTSTLAAQSNAFHTGWRFTVGASDLTVSAGRARAGSGQPGTIYVFRVSDAALLASVAFTGAGTSTWVEEDFSSSIVLSSATDYIVSTWRGGSNITRYRSNVSNTSFNAAVTYVQENWGSNADMPTNFNTDASLFLVDLKFTK